MRWFHEISATPIDQKRLIPFPDAKSHVITSSIQSKDVTGVQKATYAFAEEVLGLSPIEN